MLQITGKVLGVASETIRPEGREAFDTHTLTLQCGALPSGRPRIEDVRLGRDVEVTQFADKVGQDVTLEVYVQAYPRAGSKAGYRLVGTALLDGKAARAA